MFPVTITLSPGSILSFPNLKFSTLIPIPEVLINIPSPCPFSTTFVSPVTISTPAIFAVSLKDSIILFKISILKPSSIINPKLAPSPSIFNLLLPTLGNITFFIKFSLCSPPLP